MVKPSSDLQAQSTTALGLNPEFSSAEDVDMAVLPTHTPPGGDGDVPQDVQGGSFLPLKEQVKESAELCSPAHRMARLNRKMPEPAAVSNPGLEALLGQASGAMADDETGKLSPAPSPTGRRTCRLNQKVPAAFVEKEQIS